MTGSWSAARWYAVLAAGVVAFTVYGSLVPFQFQNRSWAEASGSFAWAMQNRLRIESRSDVVANFLLGVPLGFCVLGAQRVDRAGLRRTMVTGLAVWPACVGLAGLVEFLQVYLPTRTSSGADVAAQAAGSVAGMLAWVAAGQWLTDGARRAVADPRAGGRAGQWLAAYLAVVLLVQVLPLDLTTSPGQAYRKLRSGVVWVPFQESATPDAVKSWVMLAAVFLPAGLLAARVTGWNFPAVAVGAIGFATATEAAQLLVSRSPSATDVLVGSMAVLVGWGIGRWFPARIRDGEALLLGGMWAGLLAIAAWFPLTFQLPPRWETVAWIPFADLFSRNDLDIPGEVLTRLLAFAPCGILAVAASRGWWAVPVAVGVSAILEAGQLLVPGRVPGTTDIVLAGVGAGIAAALTRKISAVPVQKPIRLPEPRRVAA